MGMFDEIRCKYPLPVAGANELLYQTKDTPEPLYRELYEIREDGTLWVQEYDTEDRSDPNAVGIMRMVGCMTRVNKRWVKVEYFSGEINFYTGEFSFTASFVGGTLQSLIQVARD